jgi:hypothetical protein
MILSRDGIAERRGVAIGRRGERGGWRGRRPQRSRGRVSRTRGYRRVDVDIDDDGVHAVTGGIVDIGVEAKAKQPFVLEHSSAHKSEAADAEPTVIQTKGHI